MVKDRFVLPIARTQVITRELVVHPGAVAVVPFTDARHLLLIRQFRYAARKKLWEIPAGTREKNESALNCAKRELEEETGFKAKRWRRLAGFFTAPGITNELMILFQARDLAAGHKNLDPDEWIQHRKVSLEQALRMIRKGEICDAKTIIGILWTAQAVSS